MIGKFLVRLGTWLEKHFPEKISTDEVYAKFAEMDLRLHEITSVEIQLQECQTLVRLQGDRLAAVEKKLEILTSENSALKAATALRTRISSSIPIPGR